MTANKVYNNESISSLKGADRVRKRPSVIFGSDGLEGCSHSFFEILSNSIDEAREGFGQEILVVRHQDRSITVKDQGRGCPVDFNKNEGKFNWELVFCELYAGGKYSHSSDANYQYSLGLNGLGLCATQYSSEYMDVEVQRDGTRYTLHFEKGENVGGLKKEAISSRKTGSSFTWRPDLEVFTDIKIPLGYYQEVLRRQSVVNPGLKFILEDEETGEAFEYYYQQGIVDYVKEVSEFKEFTNIFYFQKEGKGKDREDRPEYRVKAEIAFLFNNHINMLEYYHNSSHLEHGGSPDKAIRSAFVTAIDREIKKQTKYTKNEKKILFIDIQDSLVLVCNSFSTITSYENQTKKSITNRFVQEFITMIVKEQLEIYFIENPLDAEKIVAQVLVNKRSREKAETTRKNIRKKLSGTVDMNNRVKKFVNCRTKDVERRELFIVEGDSALGATKQARSAEFQALMPVRGKILNCLKADYNKIFKSDIIMDLLKVLGCGIEIKSKHNKDLASFDLDQLNWNKIILCTDADVDGYQIRTLILAMFYRLTPTLIQEGRIYIAETPLFEIETKHKTYFAFNEKEKQEVIKALGDEKYILQRSKGLGENEPEMMWQTTMNPESRRLIQVMPEDLEKTESHFQMLLGEDLAGRKSYIETHGDRYLEMIDIS
ncbi:DNA topoisomerase (ATP-hydrolyzing) subunit B [Gottschalkiaceae bacterium SANA]|nr:DNA topoisomerase (ATP-hydrolyzing) subunit B [Gottschalkiaceae bacterium SANA]